MKLHSLNNLVTYQLIHLAAFVSIKCDIVQEQLCTSLHKQLATKKYCTAIVLYVSSQSNTCRNVRAGIVNHPTRSYTFYQYEKSSFILIGYCNVFNGLPKNNRAQQQYTRVHQSTRYQ